jgi:predicted MFS family arabinose efflux permease
VLVATIAPGPYFQPADRPSGQREGVWQGIRAGGTALRGQPVALRVLGADIICSAVYGALTVLLVLVAQRLHAGASGYGYLIAGLGLGGVLGTPLAGAAARATRSPDRIALALAAVAASLALLALAPNLTVAVLLCALSGAGSVLVEVIGETVLQRSLPEAVFVQAYGLALPASLGGIVLGALVATPLVLGAGLAGALIALALVVTAYVGLVFATARPRIALSTMDTVSTP